MTEPFAARADMNRQRTEMIDARALADEQEAVVRRLQQALAVGDARATPEKLAAASISFAALKSRADQLSGLFDTAGQELAQTLDAEPPLFPDRNADPIVLLPVRVETIWWEPRVLRVRIYPDDIEMEHLDEELTPVEASVAAEYWRAPGADAWQQVLVALRPDRAAWAVRACRPGAPPPVVRSIDPAAPPTRTVAMPKRWRFVGLNDGAMVVDKLGRPVPDPLPIGLFREQDSWETDWFNALVAGMAVELVLPEGVEHLDEVLVVGVRQESAAAGAARLRELLLGHAFAGGLGILADGTPTNNTPRTRSGWSSAPANPPPDADDPGDGQSPAAESLAASLDLGDSGFLRGCAGAGDGEHAVVAALSLLTWPTLGKEFADAAATHWNLGERMKGTVGSTVPWRAIRDHCADHVRSRGPLPMLRVGRQPYGVLPVTSLDDWQPDGNRENAEKLLQPWLTVLRDRWRKAVVGDNSTVPRVRPGQPVDQVVVEALSRLPVAATLAMLRMEPPTAAIGGTGIDEQPTVYGLPGLLPDGELRWTFQSDGFTDLGNGLDEQTGAPRYVTRVAPDPVAFPERATATADYFAAARHFLAGELSAADFNAQWPVLLSSTDERGPRRSTFFDLPALDTAPPADLPEDQDPNTPQPPKDATGLLDALLYLPAWSAQGGDDGDGDPLRAALAVPGEVEQLVADVVEELISDSERTGRMAAAAHKSAGLERLEQAMRTLTTVPVTRLPELLLEVIDVYSFRMDAWITSLATRRLATMREKGVDGVRFGSYGWVRDLRPPEPREEVELPGQDDTATVSPMDGYIHAPSLQHAATAAVLRSGFLAHPGAEAFAVNLTSRRSRVARWLLGGVRNGQNLGALLGYRFERALHDAQLDTEIPRFRATFGSPTADEPTPTAGPDDLWARSTEAITARNVVDGMRLARDPVTAKSIAANPGRVGPIVDDVVDALDAIGDLVLAESVHQLVGGSPLRAGVAADTIGRGGDVPDVWRVLRTPHRARAVTNRVAVLLPASAEPGPPAAPGACGWPADPLAQALPAVDTWVAALLGPAAAVTLSGTAGPPDTAQPFEVAVDRLGLGALSTMLDAAGSSQPQLTDAVRRVLQVEADHPVELSGQAWRRLHGMARRLRTLLVAAQPLLPRHLPREPADVVLDLSATRARLMAFAQTSVDRPGADALQAAAAASPDDPTRGGPDGWLTAARAALTELLGTDIPVLPALVGSPAADAPPVTVPPVSRTDVAGADVSDWLRRNGEVRPAERALHEALTLTLLMTGGQQPLHVGQFPVGSPPDDHWIGGTFPLDHRPPATTHLVWHSPSDPLPAERVCGMLLDEWVELLPGSDSLPQAAAVETELTGVAFHYDRPDAKAPHAVLIAVPPNVERGWTANGLLQAIRETSELATLRAVDDQDLPLLRNLLPAIRIAADEGPGQALSRFETKRPTIDNHAPYRLQPGYRDEQQLDAGLAARVHDPLWLLTRQWQFGEFTAQDAGSPAVIRMTGGSAPIDAWRPVGGPDWVPWQLADAPLDTQVEDEPVRVDERLRASGGAHLLWLLADANLAGAAAAALAPHLLSAGDPDNSIVDLTGGAVPDAAAVAAALDTGTFDPSQDPALAAITDRWRSWWTAQLAERGPDCFDPHRFEHAVELSVGGAVLRAAEYLGDGLDWYSFDVQLGEEGDAAAVAAPPGIRSTFEVEGLPSTVNYGGLPADRFWEMEDARIDLGATAMSTLDTGRLLLVSFATVYGNDWFLVPLEVPVGSLTTLDQLLILDVFGRDHLLDRAGRDNPSWSMFTVTSPDPDLPAASGLLVLPAEGGQLGEPLERVGLTRDELANLAWAVQHRYTDGRGEPVERRDAWLKVAHPPTPPGDLPLYRVQTDVPDYWFPLVPEPIRPDAIRFRLVDLAGSKQEPAGRLIEKGLWVHEEEVPRDGASVQRRPVLARWFDGSWHSWVRREKNPGAGESSSGLTFDTVRPTRPWLP